MVFPPCGGVRTAGSLPSADLIPEPSWGEVLLDVEAGANGAAGDLGLALAGPGKQSRDCAVADRTPVFETGMSLGKPLIFFKEPFAELSTATGEEEDLLGSSFRCLWITSVTVSGQSERCLASAALGSIRIEFKALKERNRI